MTTLTQQQTIDYALMAGAVYVSNRDVINQLPTPTGWDTFFYQSLTSGFEAVSFQNTANTNEIVISFAGTEPTSWTDWIANLELGVGIAAQQLDQAAAYYLQVLATNPNATISFTGHSLGGGLASLMAAFFNKQAVTFDQAPFANAASVSVAVAIENYLNGSAINYNTSALQQAKSTMLSDLTNFIGAASGGGIPNAGNVTDINVQGEVLSYLPLSRIGIQQPDIAVSSAGASSIDLHSLGLLTAFLLSDQAAPTQTLDAVTFKLTDLLAMMFSSKLFSNSVKTSDANFVDLIVQHQEGFSGIPASVPTGTTPTVPTTTAIKPDAMIVRFTTDLWAIAQAGGLTMNDKNITDALIAFAMQSYYEGANSNSTGLDANIFKNKHFFTAISGGLEFAITDVGKKGTLGDAKGYSQYFVKAISDNTDPNFTYLSSDERKAIKAALPAIHEWYVQAGASGMYASDATNLGAFMLGGTGSSYLTGGAGNDLLVAGMSGSDWLTAGTGNDTLIAGNGSDLSTGSGQIESAVNDASYATQSEWRIAA